MNTLQTKLFQGKAVYNLDRKDQSDLGTLDPFYIEVSFDGFETVTILSTCSIGDAVSEFSIEMYKQDVEDWLLEEFEISGIARSWATSYQA